MSQHATRYVSGRFFHRRTFHYPYDNTPFHVPMLCTLHETCTRMGFGVLLINIVASEMQKCGLISRVMHMKHPNMPTGRVDSTRIVVSTCRQSAVDHRWYVPDCDNTGTVPGVMTCAACLFSAYMFSDVSNFQLPLIKSNPIQNLISKMKKGSCSNTQIPDINSVKLYDRIRGNLL